MLPAGLGTRVQHHASGSTSMQLVAGRLTVMLLLLLLVTRHPLEPRVWCAGGGPEVRLPVRPARARHTARPAAGEGARRAALDQSK
jgi:hypothetical protein